MKIISLFLVLTFSVCLYAGEKETVDMIKKYSGKNSGKLLQLYDQKENSEYIKFLLDNFSPNDLASVTPEYVRKSIDFSLKTKEMKYSHLYDDNIFKHFVLPLRASQEPFENWRESFYNELYPIVKDIEDIEKAAILVNLWAEEQMTYKPTHGRDQGPLTTIRRGYGRCEEMMIIYMAAARSVGIPVRSAGAPFWNFTDSNHAWVEVWTPTGWKYLGEPADRLNKTWFTNTTKRSSLITSRAFGFYDEEDIIDFENGSTEISSIKYYTDKYDNCRIMIDDQQSMPVDNAKVILYAVSWGGLFPMIELKTDKNGMAEIPLGRGSVFVTAFSDSSGAGYSLFDTLEGSKDIRIELNKNNDSINTDLFFKFQINPNVKEDDKGVKSYFEGKFDLMKEKASLKRKERLNNFKKPAEFVKYYQQSREYSEEEMYFKSQKSFLEKCDILAGNTVSFIKAFKGIENGSKKEKQIKYKILTDIIEKWDDKELCEIPDSSAVSDVVNILYEGRMTFKKAVHDTIFTNYVVKPTWTGGQPPQNGWQKEFYGMIKDLRSSNIKTTVRDVITWTNSKVDVDSDFVYFYYSCPLNPIEIINMKYVPEFYRTKLIDSALKLLGIPTNWKGTLEYYNGKEFLPVETAEEKEDKKITEKTFRLKIFSDGEQIKADAWNNFILAEYDKGEINYTYFDGKNDSLDFILTYPVDKEKIYCMESGIRNTNGDANIVIRTLTQEEDSLAIHLSSPKEYLDVSTELGNEAEKIIKKFAENLNITGYKILLIRGIIPNEPTDRMTNLLTGRINDIKQKGSKLIVYTEIRDDGDISETDGLIKKKGDILIPEIADEDYPLVVLINEKNKIVFASKGYNMNIADLLLKKIKKN